MQGQAVSGPRQFQWSQLIPFWPVIIGLLCMYLPTIWKAYNGFWNEQDHAHSPLILLVVLFLLWWNRKEIAAIVPEPQVVLGSVFLFVALIFYIFGQSQDIYLFSFGSLVPLGYGLLLLFGGWPAVRAWWFPVFFLIFLIPIPSPIIDALTSPLKTYISEIAEEILYKAGYPISRSGVILFIGRYQLMVADACSGLNSMFSLSAMGCLYLYLMHHKSFWRNLLILLAIIPFAFIANVIRVLILILVTYHFGDAAGQGFIHEFAGMILFAIALIFLFAWDGILGLFFRKKEKR